jgi:hypothetical protein
LTLSVTGAAGRPHMDLSTTLTVMSSIADVVTGLEVKRLRALVEVNADVLDRLHASDFVLVHPSGGTWSKEQYVGGVLSGEIDYLRFEPVSGIEVMTDRSLAVLRYRSAIEIQVRGQQPGLLECWHTDCYRREAEDSPWQVVWSQATECA